MALPYAEDGEPKGLPAEEKKKAMMNLWLVVIAIDILVIAAVSLLVLGLGWDPTDRAYPAPCRIDGTGLYFAVAEEDD